jgi:hypothetical protein
VFTGVHQLFALWERPPDPEGVDPADSTWECPPLGESAAVDRLMLTYRVMRWNGDPPHWLESHATWSGKYPGVVEEWFTQQHTRDGLRGAELPAGTQDGSIKYARDDRPYRRSHVPGETMGEALRRHIGNAGRHDVNLWDDEGQQLFVLEKIQPERKFDACMADILANEARLDVLASKKLQQDDRPLDTFQRTPLTTEGGRPWPTTSPMTPVRATRPSPSRRSGGSSVCAALLTGVNGRAGSTQWSRMSTKPTRIRPGLDTLHDYLRRRPAAHGVRRRVGRLVPVRHPSRRGSTWPRTS